MRRQCCHRSLRWLLPAAIANACEFLVRLQASAPCMRDKQDVHIASASGSLQVGSYDAALLNGAILAATAGCSAGSRVYLATQ
jgi:hypothetical protein